MTLYSRARTSGKGSGFGFGVKAKGRRAFTLVEILVVMVIIALLVGVSISGLRLALVSSKKARCALNLRAIGAGMLAFAGDNNQNLPTSGGTIDHGQVDAAPPAGSGLPSWTEQLEPYLGPSSDTAANLIYKCPDSSVVWPQNNAQYSYFNGSHAAYTPSAPSGITFHPVNLLRIHSLSAYIMAGDSAFGGFAGNGTQPDADKDNYSSDPAFNMGTPTAPVTIPIHGGVCNILFADGHVEALKYFDATAITTSYAGPGSTYTVLYSPP